MASNVHVYPSDRFFHLGLEMAGFSHAMIENTCLNTNLERFSSFFFASPETCEHVYRDIQDESIEGCIGLKDPKPERFLLALYFLKKYPTKQELAAFLKMTEKTALNWAHTYVEAIRSLKDEKIKWIFANDYEGKPPEILGLSCDGLHCPIEEPRNEPSAKWYSKKSNGAGLAYELAAALWSDQIVSINGPFPAGHNDSMIFGMGLKQKMASCNVKGLADKGYTGHNTGKRVQKLEEKGLYGGPGELLTKNEFDSKALRDFKRRALARHESLNSRFKSFKILAERFRPRGLDRMERHKCVFEACAVLVQYELENGKGLFKI